MLSEHPFTKDNLDNYLKELAKEFRKRNGTTIPAEVILIGGAAVVINYGFREMTYDMDVVIEATSAMREAINYVGDKHGLPNGWMNTDFMKTQSYTPRIAAISKYYKTYSNIVTFRTVSGKYLIAMKMMAGRQYKYDLSDIIGILRAHEQMGEPLTIDEIKDACIELYDSYENIPEGSRRFVENAFIDCNYEALYQTVRQMESENKTILLEFQKHYPDVMNTDNVDDIIKRIRQKKND